jgi:DNA polymerase alpha subunit B
MDLGTLGLAYVESVNRTEQPYRRVHCVPNPCTLRINELVVGLTSTDVLLQVSTNETNARLPAGSRLTRIAQHLVQQQSYYPLFPAQVNLDWQQRQHWRMPCRPDLLILPSKLSPMAKTIDSTVVINPGPLTRDTTGGTYAVLEVHPMDRTTLEETDAQVSLPHQAAQRTRVQVKRI